jgi:hypothetical protein
VAVFVISEQSLRPFCVFAEQKHQPGYAHLAGGLEL